MSGFLEGKQAGYLFSLFVVIVVIVSKHIFLRNSSNAVLTLLLSFSEKGQETNYLSDLE